MLQDLSEISDGKIYTSNDMARVACQDCAGCHACCEGMGESIVLDPMDMWRFRVATGKGFEELMQKEIELNVVDGLILPNLAMTGESGQCAFLSQEGRCSIHAYRPGLCRAFPLGRIYEEQSIRYFLQPEGCKKTERTKVKVSKWLDTPQLKKYEDFLLAWHGLRRRMEERIGKETSEQTAKTINMFLLNLFYVTPYDAEQDFYTQFAARMEQVTKTLG